MTRDPLADAKKMVQSVTAQLVGDQVRDIEQACADPDSERCRYYRTLFNSADGGTAARVMERDGGSGLTDQRTELEGRVP
jgi:hypothetical protein